MLQSSSKAFCFGSSRSSKNSSFFTASPELRERRRGSANIATRSRCCGRIFTILRRRLIRLSVPWSPFLRRNNSSDSAGSRPWTSNSKTVCPSLPRSTSMKRIGVLSALREENTTRRA